MRTARSRIKNFQECKREFAHGRRCFGQALLGRTGLHTNAAHARCTRSIWTLDLCEAWPAAQAAQPAGCGLCLQTSRKGDEPAADQHACGDEDHTLLGRLAPAMLGPVAGPVASGAVPAGSAAGPVASGVSAVSLLDKSRMPRPGRAPPPAMRCRGLHTLLSCRVSASRCPAT